MKKNKVFAAVFCMLLMIFTGASDALRGVFLPLFRDHFALSQSQASRIIMMSYVGNLIFLLVGGIYVLPESFSAQFVILFPHEPQ